MNGQAPNCPRCNGWLHFLSEDYMNSVSIQAQCTRCEYTWDSACHEAVEWEYAQVKKLRDQGIREPEWQPMKAGTGRILERYPRAAYTDSTPSVGDAPATVTLHLSGIDQVFVDEIRRLMKPPAGS